MMDRQQIEARIEQVVAGASSAAVLSHELFRRGGLFSHLANDRAEREALVDSALFRKAQRRLSELQRGGMEGFRPSSTKRAPSNEAAQPTPEQNVSTL